MDVPPRAARLSSAKADSPATDRDLILACRSGDKIAWERLLDKYERLVYSIPLNYGLTSEDAADISQITFTILIQSLDRLRDDTRLATWLATVARRHTWRLLARSRREAVDPREDLNEREWIRDSVNPLERWELLNWVTEGLNLLDDRCRKLLIALYFDADRQSYAEVAAYLNMPLGSVGPTRARCLERLKQHLTETGLNLDVGELQATDTDREA